MKVQEKTLLNKIAIVILVLASILVLANYFLVDITLDWNDLETKFNRTITYAFFIAYFFAISLLLNFKSYIYVYGLMLISCTPLWLILYVFQTTGSLVLTSRNTLTIPLFTVVSPGLTFNFMQIIKNKSKKFANNKILGKYHIHEGFIGIILIIVAIILLISRSLVNSSTLPEDIRELILALIGILLFVFTYSGSFLIFRDFQDIKQLKFLEKKNQPNASDNIHISETFNELSPESLKFFKLAFIKLYPIGMLVSSIGIIMIVHTSDFLSQQLFGLTREIIVLLGFLCVFFSGALVGFDWYRLFERCYPHLYEEVESVKRKIENEFPNEVI